MKRVRFILRIMIYIFTISILLSGNITLRAMAVSIPTPIVVGISTSYMTGDSMSIKLTSTGTTSLVQYKVVLVNETAKKTVDVLNGYTVKYYNPKTSYQVTYKLSEAGKYIITITSKLGGYKTSYSKSIVKSFTVNSNVNIIDRIEPVTGRVNIGESYAFPTKVNAKMKDGSFKEFDVVWDKNTIDTSLAGIQSAYGTVAGYSGRVLLAVNVVDEKIVSIDPIAASVEEGAVYAMPDKVTARLKNGTINAAVKWNVNTADTSRPGTYTYEGTVEGFSGKAVLVLTVKPVSFSLNRIFSNDLRQIFLEFNKGIDIKTISDDKFRLFQGTKQITVNAELLDDDRTIVLTPSVSGIALDKNMTHLLIFEGVKDLSGNEVEKLPREFIAKDIEAPRVINITASGPQNITIEFSEPIKNTSNGFVEIKNLNNVMRLYPTYEGYDTKKITVRLQSALYDDVKYDISIKGFKDFADNECQPKTQQITYVKDTKALEARIRYIDQTCAELVFNKEIRGLARENIYDTTIGRSPIGIYLNPEMTEPFIAGTVSDRVWVKFYDTLQAIGNPITDTSEKLVIQGRVNSNEIKDNWGNVLQNISLPFKITVDKSAPEIKDIREETESSLIVEFNEEVRFTSSNLDIESNGAKILGSILSIDKKSYRINLAKAYAGQTLAITIKNLEDRAIVPNKLLTWTKTLEITDKTPPQVTKVIKKFIAGADQSLYVYFNEALDSSGTMVSNYYIQNPTTFMMVKLTEKPVFYNNDSSIVKLPLTNEQRAFIDSGYSLFVQEVCDVSKNSLTGQVIPNSSFVLYDSSSNKPRVTRLEAVDKNTLIVTFNQQLKRVDIGAFMLNTSVPSSISLKTNSEGNTAVTLVVEAGKEFLSDLKGITLLNIITDANKRIENDFGLCADNAFFMINTTPAIEDRIPPALRLINGVPQIKTFTNYSGIVDAIALEYEEDIDSTKLSALSYSVQGRSIARVYTNSTGTKGFSSTGKYVIIELKTDGITSSNTTRPIVTQVLDIYDMKDNKLVPNGQPISTADSYGPEVTTKLASQIGRGETRTIVFSKTLSDTSKTLVQSIITAYSGGKGILIYNWNGSILSITNISPTDATNFVLTNQVKVTITDTEGNVSYNVVIIGL